MAAHGDTIVSLFNQQLRENPDRTALHLFRADRFAPISWNELASDVYNCAAKLRHLGVEPGDRVVQVSENRYEWVVLDLAVHAVQAVHVAIHCVLSGKQIAEQIADCEPTLIVVSNETQAAKLAADGVELPQNAPIFSHDVVSTSCGTKSIPRLADQQGDREAGQQLLQDAAETLNGQSLATILYTSGTTGEPKGVMLWHGNLTSNAIACAEAFGPGSQNRRLCWLPLSHIYARTSDMYVWLAIGGEMAIARSRETLIADCALVQPTFINGVPYFYDKLMRHLLDAGKGDHPGVLLQLLGGKITACCAGGAALSDETARFFERQGVTLVQGYGLTEASPVISTCTPTAQRIGTVGPPLPNVEVRIADDGEVLTRGPHVMQGYWRKPEATAEVIRDGWLHTGDLGAINDGFLRITGRKKEIIVLSSGKNIAPALIERLLCDDPLIAQAMIVGDNRNYLAALIVPDVGLLKTALAPLGLADLSGPELLQHPSVQSLYKSRIDAQLVDLSSHEQLGKFRLISRGFSIDAGELTPTLKLRRAVIAANFASEVAAMYPFDPQLTARCP